MEKEEKWYGFSFVKENAGGLGAAIYAITMAYFYADTNKLKFGLVEEGIAFPRLNGAINDIGGSDKNWHSYFKSLPIIKTKDTISIWRDYSAKHNAKRQFNGKKIIIYSELLKYIYILQEDIKTKVDLLVEKSGFNSSTDVVLHIRRTDKIFANKGSVIEAGELPLIVYINETVKIVKNLKTKNPDIKYRVFLCTDDKKICNEIAETMLKDDIEVVWDKSETERHIQCMRMSGDLKRSDAWEENMSALKNLAIMSRGIHLIGGRMSYFFRVAELLRYPLPTKNLKDVEKFGKAQYAEDNEYFANPMRTTRYPNFVSSVYLNKSIEDWKSYTDILNKEHIINVPNFMSSKIAEFVFTAIKAFPDNWWTHAIKPVDKTKSTDNKVEYVYRNSKDADLAACVAYAEKAADSGQFAYHFQRTTGKHFTTCKCVACRLRDSFYSYGVMSILSKIVGKTVIGMNEMFASKYTRHDFLTMHHDKDKGHYTFILSLTKDWNPVHGGLTHFCDADKNVYKTEKPTFNNLIIFKLDPSRKMDHFVSRVSGPNPRFAFTGWFNIETDESA